MRPSVEPDSEAPPASHVLWAREQSQALLLGGAGGRCSASTPPSLLPALPRFLLADCILRPWAMSAAAALVARLHYLGPTTLTASSHESSHEASCVAALSFTGGVLAVRQVRVSRCLSDWLTGRLLLVSSRGPIAPLLVVDSLDGSLPQSWCVWHCGSGCIRPSGIVYNRRWIIKNESISRGMLCIWDLQGADEHPAAATCLTCAPPAAEFREQMHVNWRLCVRVDTSSEGEVVEANLLDDEDEAALFVVKDYPKTSVVFVDIRESHSTGKLCVKSRLRGCRGVQNQVLHSGKHPVMLSVLIPPDSHPRYMLIDAETGVLLRKCQSWPHKVDSRHFVEVTHHNSRLEVFSTEDLTKPCHVIRNDTRLEFMCGGDGHIAFLEEDNRIDVVDAISGSLTLSLSVRPGFCEHSFRFYVVPAA
ncbi:hypothetical protein Pelo_2148 [Pelomyxa schiedti]|nr:hypothetical protein Pelo_2148 [Pelomyxa schiedti]